MPPTDPTATPLTLADLPEVAEDVLAAAIFGDALAPGEPAITQPGDVVGLYTLVEKLGDGGFGTVWKAEQTTPVKREVALKILKLGMDTLEVMGRFEQERHALALMDHPNIAKVLDAGMTREGRPFFVMELVRGQAITRYCLEKALPLEARLVLMREVCAGVQHAHQKSVIHRDLKPSNVLVTEIDGVPVPKIIDFGIAKATTTDRLTEFTLVTRFDQMMGTPIYMSPEQADASPDIDTRSDVYSLGTLLYELIAGRPPFDAKTLHQAGHEEMRRIIREVEPKPPSRRSDEARITNEEGGTGSEFRHTAFSIRHSKDLDIITLRALEKDRNRRYESATSLGADIQRFLNHEPISARAPSMLYLLQRWLQRHRALAAAASFILVAICVGIAATYREKQRAEAALQLMASALSETDTISYVSLTRMGEVLTLAAAKADQLPDREQLGLHTGLGKAYWGLRDWNHAIVHIEKAEALAQRLKSPADMLRELREIHALCLLGGQRSKEALAITEQMIPDYEQNLLSDDPAKIFIRTLHAKALRSSGQPKEAVTAFEDLFKRLDEWPSEPNPVDVISAHLSYPIALRQAGETERALVEARKNIRQSKKLLGLVDLHTARAYIQAANECMFAGLTQEAHDYQKEAWQLFFDTLGPAHFSTQEAKDDLIRLKQKLGLVEEAIEVHQDTVTMSKAMYGPMDPGTLEAVEALIQSLLDSRRRSEALTLAQATVHELEALKNPPAEIATRWLPILKARLKEARKAVPGK